MMMTTFLDLPLDRPTLFFVGVTTSRSSIMKVFPRWAEALGLGDCAIRGLDFPLHADPSRYREAVASIKEHPRALGALVTTHKIDLLRASSDLFDELDEHAQLMGEVSCLSKREGRLIGHAKDPVSSGLALQAFLPEGYWQRTAAEACILGAGGSAAALTWALLQPGHGANRPVRVIVANRSRPRLDEMRDFHQRLASCVPVEYHHTQCAEENDALVNALRPHSLVVNATGLGKDAPGSPLTGHVRFPRNGAAWDFNYRGELLFLRQARRQEAERNIHVEDGWQYFLHGWTQVVAEVFGREIPSSGPVFESLGRIAAAERSVA
jgi:shikimate 5-dehydrogenase